MLDISSVSYISPPPVWRNLPHIMVVGGPLSDVTGVTVTNAVKLRVVLGGGVHSWLTW